MLEALEMSPVICAVKDEAGLAAALRSEGRVIFLLYGTICTLGEQVARIHAAGKTAIVHIEMIDGFSSREVVVDFVSRHTLADGIISTKAHMIKAAKERGLITVQRVFLLDSLALDNTIRRMGGEEADFFEILPGMMPKIIRKLVGLTHIPIIAGGMLLDKEDAIAALAAGAVAVSTSAQTLWEN